MGDKRDSLQNLDKYRLKSENEVENELLKRK